MVFGLLKDIKNGEYRTIAPPNEIASIAADGHTVLVQKGAGEKAGFEDAEYVKAGARLVDTMEEIYAQADFVTKVKELEPCEFPLLREGQIIFTCIHPAAHPQEVQAILDSKCIAFTAEDCHRYGSPNCEAAGKVGALLGKVVNSTAAMVTGTGLLTLAQETRKMRGGFVMLDNDVEINCTFETLVRLQREKLENQAAELLFEN